MHLKSSFITISSMRFHAFHGVLEQERLTGNDYEVTVRIGVDLSTAAESDDVADTVNYATIYNKVSLVMQTPSRLIENVAHRIAEETFAVSESINSDDVTVCKKNPPMGADCRGAEVEMSYVR